MAHKKSDRIKRYFVVTLALGLCISAYFRVIKPKVHVAKASVQTSPALPVQLKIPEMVAEQLPIPRAMEPVINTLLQTAIKDIFSPRNIMPVRKPEMAEKKKPEPPGPSFRLKGTIVGGERPIAIINDQFVRPGDEVGGFRVVRIGKNQVQLSTGGRTLTLEMMKNE